MTAKYHNPVLLHESVEGLAIRPEGTYVDATFGGGGHSRAILEKLGRNGRLIAFDRDLDAQANLPDDSRLTLVHHDFVFLKNFLRYLQALPVDGILADLGISSHQVDTPERGFSFRYTAPLDMRMDKGNPVTAAVLLNGAGEEELQRIFSEYGEVRNARSLARAIVTRRQGKPFSMTSELVQIAEALLPARENLKKYMAPVFQALRIAVNGELDGLKTFLTQCGQVLKPGGRLVVITYHSLEDRLVKNFIQTGNFEGKAEKDLYGNYSAPWSAVNRKPILPTEKEITDNPRARSAKLRIAESV